ncbi:hypothetical protein RclHR1_00380003 [Rhizophagus clarus]|uniref:Uncharacterized protein n=1 Tax=Rhizophagus clarus TaxID=94130 RepID=A0A2Z6RPX3_9GLOM|nr:hypothetical protein RclHR1_00380003 [Rhizophagus clarus]
MHSERLERVDSQEGEDEEFAENIHVIATGNCLPMFYLSKKKRNINFDLTSFLSRVKAGPPRGVTQGPN